jgi:hypothetical protein
MLEKAKLGLDKIIWAQAEQNMLGLGMIEFVGFGLTRQSSG